MKPILLAEDKQQLENLRNILKDSTKESSA